MFKCVQGKLVGIAGPFSSGKTSLIRALLGQVRSDPRLILLHCDMLIFQIESNFCNFSGLWQYLCWRQFRGFDVEGRTAQLLCMCVLRAAWHRPVNWAVISQA